MFINWRAELFVGFGWSSEESVQEDEQDPVSIVILILLAIYWMHFK